MALVKGEDGRAVGAAEPEVGLPMAGGEAVGGAGGALDEGPAVLDKGDGAAPGAAAAATSGLRLGQIVAPGEVVGAAALGVDEAGDGLVGDDGVAGGAGEAPGHLLGGAALGEVGQDQGAQDGVAIEARAGPAAGAGLLLGIPGLVALGVGSIAGQLASNR